MPQKKKLYEHVIFTPEVIEQGDDLINTILPKEYEKLERMFLSVGLSDEEKWYYDNEEEFFADYRKGFRSATFEKYFMKMAFNISVYGNRTEVAIRMPSRAQVEKVFHVFESNVEKCRLPEPPAEEPIKPIVRVFIGHGRSPQWRDLKDHLHEKHGLAVESYESGARAGITIRDVLDEMLTSSSFAILILTGEDLDAGGRLHARENVIHELGLFQGRLGWRKAIVLLEEGVEEFSNIHGLNHIPFRAGNIKETFGEVLATISREFSDT